MRAASWLLVVLGLLASSLEADSARAAKVVEEERLIGWKGDTYREDPGRRGGKQKHLWLEHISWSPRAYIIHNLITKKEARHIAELAWTTMTRSTTVGENGTYVTSEYRTSYNTFLERHQTPVLRAVQERVASIVRVPVVNQEGMQVLRYGIGQYYKPHQDPLDNDTPRMATVLIYLSDVEEGGETSFPESSWVSPQVEAAYAGGLSQCAKGQVGFKPRIGDGLLFFSLAPDGKTQPSDSMHQGCPVIKGAKWTATVWIHSAAVEPDEWDEKRQTFKNQPRGPFPDPALCKDEEKMCKSWAEAGECKKNEEYMTDNCPASCGKCTQCAGPQDAPCLRANRQKMNLLLEDPTKEMDWGENDLEADLIEGEVVTPEAAV